MSEEWPGGDPFADPNDPAAQEREKRRLEREEKRRKRADKRGRKREAASLRPPARPTAAEPPPPLRTPEQEFWDEPAEPAPAAAAMEHPATTETPGEVGRAGALEPADPGPPAEPNSPAAAEPHDGGEAPAAAESPARHAADQPWRARPAELSRAISEEGDSAQASKPGGRDPRQPRGGRGVLGALRRHPLRIGAGLVALAVLWFLFSLFQPFHGDGSGRVAVTIPKGSSVSEVGDLLGKKGVIDSSTLFQIRVTLDGKRSDLFPGRYRLAHGMSYSAAIDALTTPREKPTATTVTIPEGYSRPQAAQLVKEDGLTGSYMKETVHSKYLNPARYGGKGAKNLEGFLFPDTFELKPRSPVANLVQLQLQDFQRRIKGVNMSYARAKNLTTYDVLTIASMVEREAGVASQRKLVASVIYNRLRERMPLGIDATIRFATGNYEEPLTETQLAIDSPYNTRTNTGLPPGPIDSPGLAAIQAAAHPARTAYLFYVNNPSKCDELTFSKTEAEFEANVEKYNSAREANGGNQPSTCGE